MIDSGKYQLNKEIFVICFFLFNMVGFLIFLSTIGEKPFKSSF